MKEKGSSIRGDNGVLIGVAMAGIDKTGWVGEILPSGSYNMATGKKMGNWKTRVGDKKVPQ